MEAKWQGGIHRCYISVPARALLYRRPARGDTNPGGGKKNHNGQHPSPPTPAEWTGKSWLECCVGIPHEGGGSSALKKAQVLADEKYNFTLKPPRFRENISLANNPEGMSLLAWLHCQIRILCEDFSMGKKSPAPNFHPITTSSRLDNRTYKRGSGIGDKGVMCGFRWHGIIFGPPRMT